MLAGRLELALIIQLIYFDQNAKLQLPIDPDINWPVFFILIRRHRVWHSVYRALISESLQKSTIPIAAGLTRLCQLDERRILMTAGETVLISRLFKTQKIAHCFVKGTLLNVHLYGGLNTRPCKDIDVWVDLNNYNVAMAVLLDLGYQQILPNYVLGNFKKAYYLRNKHDFTFYHPTKHVIVELHFRLSYFGIDFFPLKDVPLVSISLLNVPILAPQDDYHLLYLMIHGSIHAWIRLRWLHDIVLFIDSNRCDLQHVWDLSSHLNCQHIVEQTFILVEDLFATNNPIVTQFLLSPSQRGMKLASLAQQFISSDYEMTDGIRNIKMFIKYRFYLAKLAVSGQKGRAFWGDLFKIDVLFPYLTFPHGCSFLYYLAYPLWVMRYIWKSMIKRESTGKVMGVD